MSHDSKHDHPEPDFNAILDRVEKMIREGSLDQLPSPPADNDAKNLVRIATEQEAMGEFTHLESDPVIVKTMQTDPESARRIHGKAEPKVYVETYG